MTIEYYKGEEIVGQLSGDTIDNLADKDFKVILYTGNKPDIVILKSEMTELDYNKYLFVIPTSVSKTMALGQYTMEMLFAEKSIWKGFAFSLMDSHSKNYIPND